MTKVKPRRPRIIIEFIGWPEDARWKYPDTYLWATEPTHTRGFLDDEDVYHNGNVTDASAFDKVDHLSNSTTGDEIWIETPDRFHAEDSEDGLRVWRRCKVVGVEDLSKDES